MPNMKKLRGFTLLEVMLSVSILAIMAGIMMPMYLSFMTRNDLDIAVNTIVEGFRRAQTLSQAGGGDTTWGVHIQTGSILLYKGVNYASRDATYDEDTSMPNSIVPAGVLDVVFAKATGLPQSYGTTTLTSQNNETRTITLNQKGMVDY
jgi:prepilin-type N-terminal cleavage/methylation domain-containing protein